MERDKGQYLNRPSTRWIYFKGVAMCMKDWSRSLGIRYHTLHKRLTILNWSIEKALTTSVRSWKHDQVE